MSVLLVPGPLLASWDIAMDQIDVTGPCPHGSSLERNVKKKKGLHAVQTVLVLWLSVDGNALYLFNLW